MIKKEDRKKMDKTAETNTRSVVRQFRELLMKLYYNKYTINKISIDVDYDRRLQFPDGPKDTGDRILTVKYNIFRKAK